MMRAALVLVGMLVVLSGLAKLSHAASWVDPLDGTTCDAYRVGSREVDVCQDHEVAR